MYPMAEIIKYIETPTLIENLRELKKINFIERQQKRYNNYPNVNTSRYNGITIIINIE